MAISNVTNTVDTTGTTAVTGANKTTDLLNTDAFMNMLVTQLKYQDPLDPMKTNEFMSQLAQLTQVERLQNIQDALGNLDKTIMAGNVVNMIGKKVAVDGNTLSQGDEITVKPLVDYDKVILAIKDLKTNATQGITINKGESLTWTNEGANTVQVAAYAIKDGSVVDSSAEVYRIITGVKSSGGSSVLVAGNGDEYPASSISLIKN